ncbi:MAG: hydantoinase/oxoprolinase family protein [Egibacteraceae bacterium]
MIRLGIDTGGTFTDIVAFDEGSGRVATTKTPSTPHDPSRGFMEGVRKILDEIGADAEQVAAVSHGTTVATNALLEDDFSGLGFVTTEGFRALLEIARQSVPEGYGNSYFWVKPDRIVPLHHVRQVPERLDVNGDVVRKLDDEAVAEVARWFRDQGIDAVGVSLLHAYLNAEHEERVREIFIQEHPDCSLSISSEVLREYREYERAITTLVDAFVKPRVGAYMAELRERLDELVPQLPFYVMKSNGGVISASEVPGQPITTILSGPAAGALGAAVVAEAAGFERVLTLDGGGTSTDVGVVTSGEPALTTEGSVGRFPTKVPMVDIVTVGTGGGSIAWVSGAGERTALKVGPRSAGADPGPLCYGQGGEEPTVTDAHLMLGRIPAALLGGEISLETDAARTGLEQLAGSVGMETHDCAAGVLEIAAWSQANAIRQVTVRRGLDVRDFVMATFGGSGPLQVCRLIDILNLDAGLVPLNPGNLSAFGLLTVDVRNDYVQTFVVRHDELDLERLTKEFETLEERAQAALREEGFDEDEHRLVRQADLRYFGQAFEVRVDAPDGSLDKDFAETVRTRFHNAHEQLYGYSYTDDSRHGVEWVNLRVSGIGPITTPELARSEPDEDDASRARTGQRDVFFDGDWHETPLYDRHLLRAGDRVAGPAVIEEFGSTVPLSPGFAATVDDYGNLVVRAEETS